MPENVVVFAEVPLSIREKLVRGEGPAVNANDVDPSGLASFTILIEAGKMTALAARARS
jgi:hypothetical protein